MNPETILPDRWALVNKKSFLCTQKYQTRKIARSKKRDYQFIFDLKRGERVR